MHYHLIFSIGLIFLAGLALSGILRKLKIPSVTSYIILGIALGALVFNIISSELLNNSDVISTVVLSIIAFSLGQNFFKENFRQIDRNHMVLSFSQSMGSVILVGSGVFLLTGNLLFSFALASVSAPTSPTSIVMAVRRLKIKGKFPEVLMGTVALSELWGLVIFAFGLAVIRSVSGSGGIAGAMGEIFGALALGIVMGWILVFFIKIITRKSEFLILTLGFILFNTGLSLVLGFSTILSAMAMSATAINIAPSSFNFFHSLRSVDSPLYLLFFVLAGAKLQLAGLNTLAVLGAVYIISRMAGKITGIYIGSMAVDFPAKLKGNLGLALSPQAGVALGLAIVMASFYPDQAAGKVILSVIVGTTVIFEIFGPFLTRYALIRSSRH